MKRFQRLLFALGLATCAFRPPSGWADWEALQTKEGVGVKVVTKMATAIYREPNEASGTEPAGAFRFFFVVPAKDGTTEKTQNGFYHVSRTSPAKVPAGWVRQSDVIEWDHAQVVGFSPTSSREQTLFFARSEDAAAYHRGEPGAENKAISREPAQRHQALFPLLKVEAVDSHGEKLEIYKLAYLSGKSASRSPQVAETASAAKKGTVSEAVPQNLSELQDSFVLQIAFVIDTTASMTPWIEGMKHVIAEVADRVRKIPGLKGRVEFGIVGFRDQLADPAEQKQMEYVTKILSELTADHEVFQQRLATVQVARIASEDHPEDALAGLIEAIKNLKWSKSGFKHIVLMTDAPAHKETSGYKNTLKQSIPGVLTLAQPTTVTAAFDRIQLHGLRIVSDLPEETKQDFDELTRGRDVSGLHFAYADEADEAKFVEELTRTLGKFTHVTNQVVKGDFTQITQAAQQAAPGSDDQKVLGGVVEMLRAVNGAEQKNGTATFEEGFACVIDREGNRCLEPHVLVSQLQMRLFASAVEHCILSLETAGDPGNRNVSQVVQNLQILATGVNLKEEVHPDLKLDALLSRILGVPIRNPVFSITPAKLAAMTSADFDAWKEQVHASQTICAAHLSNGVIWFALGNEPNPRASEMHAYIKVSDLP